MDYDEDFEAQRKFGEAEMKSLLRDNWSVVIRIAKKVERLGQLTVHLLHSGIAHELCLMHRDNPVLHNVLASCSDGGVVSMQLLREAVKDARPPTAPARRMPPYAIGNHDGHEDGSAARSIESRQAAFRSAALAAAGGKHVVSRKSFGKVVAAVDRFGVSDREAADLFTVLDPKRTGHVNLDEFCDRFAREFLKPKSMRPTLGATGVDGRSNAFEWSVTESPRRVGSASPRARDGAARSSPRRGPTVVKPTRASALRRDLTAGSARSRDVPPSSLPQVPMPPQRQRVNLSVLASPRMLGNIV
uniref:EF-hand domain-containing protein n=1 Tax=Neobodo designis TaxID=312471 RepID=A0A7S1Q475_NEODS